MGLTDNIDSAGLSDTSDNTQYKQRVLGILNCLQQELYPLSDSYAVVTAGKRPVLARLEQLRDLVGLDDYLTQTVLPCGLAAHLLLDENPAAASFFQQRYEELKASAKRLPSSFEAIEDAYGGIEHGAFSKW